MSSFRRMTVCVAICVWTVLPGAVLADFIGDSDGNTVTATAGSIATTPDNLLNGSGMSGSPVLRTSTASGYGWSNVWVTEDYPQGDETLKTDLLPSQKWVKFKFANTTKLGEIAIWNLNRYYEGAGNHSNQGLKDVVITCSTGTDASGLGTPLFTGQLHSASHPVGNPAQPITDDLAVSADNVKALMITYTTNWYDPATDNTTGWAQYHYGLSEVRFGVDAIPEPSALTLLIMGLLGLLAYAWRKRK